MPLTYAQPGEDLMVCRIGGPADVKRHLSNLGFTAGTNIRIVSKLGENLIVLVKDARIALNKDLARRISVQS